MGRLVAFLKQEQRKAYLFCLYQQVDKDDAFDVLQDAMIAMHSHYQNIDEQDHKPVFYRIVRNKIIDHQRKQKRLSQWLFWLQDKNDEEIDYLSVFHHPSSEDEVVQQLRFKQMFEAVGQLPSQQRDVFIMKVITGLSELQVAQALEISAGSVKTHLHRAKKKLSHDLQEEGG